MKKRLVIGILFQTGFMLLSCYATDHFTERFAGSKPFNLDGMSLTYGLNLNTNGLQSAWDFVGADFETTTGAVDADFESVTNAIPITGIDVGFVNLEVTED